MEIFRGLDTLPDMRDCYLTIGSFDGLHRGHQEIVKKVVSYATANNSKSVVVTFDPHPRHILNPADLTLPLLMSIEKKLELLKAINVDVALIIPFNQEFSRITAAEFLDDIIIRKFQPRRLVIGCDHHFGQDRSGTAEFTAKYLAPKNIDLEIVEPIHDENVVISSTHIRELIQAGFVRRASFELGWVYGFQATIVYGAQRGRSLNFPTANFIPLEENQLLPENGVYLTRARLNSENIYGMCNLGIRPTFNEEGFVMEVHFFDMVNVELYGRELTVEFLERIRDERKFESKEKLIEQLEKDKQYCFELLSKYK